MKTFKEIREACWKGYIQVGTKEKNGRTVPNCVPNPDGKIAKQKKEEKIPKGYHRMPDGSLMKDSDHPKGAKKENLSLAPKGKGREAAKKLYKASYEEIKDELKEVSPAQRRARKQASLLRTMAKYRQASKMGIPASQVNQRRSHPTRKKT